MLRLLVRRELLDHLLSFRFALACVLCCVLVLSAMLISGRHYDRAAADHDANVRLHDQEIRNYYAWSRLLWEGARVDRLLNVLSIFSRGGHRQFALIASVNAYREPEVLAQYKGNPIARLFLSLDLEFFVTMVMSLLAFVFSYDAVCGEKEQGTLKLMLSYSVPRHRLLLGKWIGGYLALVAPFLIALVSGWIVLTLFPRVHPTGREVLALFGMTLVALVYLAALYSLGLFVSTRTHWTATAIVVLILIWSAMAVIIPSVAPYFAARIVPTKPIGEIEAEKRSAQRDIEAAALREREQYTMEELGGWFLYAAKMNEMRRDEVLRHAASDDRINESFRNRMSRQVQIAKYLSRISPLSSASYAISGLAATSPEDDDRFWNALVRYRKTLCHYAFTRWAEMARANAYRLPKDTYEIEDYPRFEYAEQDLRDRLHSVLPDLLMLLGWSVLLFLAAHLSFLRYDVR